MRPDAGAPNVLAETTVSPRSWEHELAERLSKVPPKELRARCERGATRFHDMRPAIDVLNKVGVRPWIKGGLAIGALRHHGFIDFGGGEYGPGFDDDPDFMLTSKHMKKARFLDKRFRSGELPVEYAKGLGDLEWIEWLTHPEGKPMTVGRYVRGFCDCGEATATFFETIGVDLSESYGATMENPKTDLRPMDVTPCLDWMDNASCVHIVCWTNTASILAKSPYGSLMRVYKRDSIFPLREVPFYGTTMPAAKDAEAQLALEWGADCLTTIKAKAPDDYGGKMRVAYNGTSFSAMKIDNCAVL